MESGAYLSPIRANSVVDSVVSRLTSAIMNGELKPGMKIPTEPDLVQAFGVGRSTIREAVRILVSYGILEVRRADGTYVCDGFSPKILDPMLYGIVLQKESAHHELIGLRKLLDNGILEQLFYQSMSQEIWDNLYAIQDDLEAYLRTGENNVQTIAKKDIAFHRGLAAATDNIAVLTVYNSIVRITEDFLYRTIETILRHDAMAYFSESHRGILQKLAGPSLHDLHERVEWSYVFWNTAFQEQEEDQGEEKKAEQEEA